MSGTRSDEIGGLASETAVRACWAQWVALGSAAAPADRLRARAMIDPEALVLLSLAVEARERRLTDMVAWWARVGSALTSVQRFRSVAERFPGDTGAGALGRFARLAGEAGDRRWARHRGTAGSHVDPGAATRSTGRGRVRADAIRDKGPDAPHLAEAPALWLRLRAGLGVGAKADALAFLVGSGGAWASAEQVAFATGYSTVAARTAVTEMALAGFVREGSGRPARYAAPLDAWNELLSPRGPEGVPPWRFWSETFAFLAGAAHWADEARAAEAGGTPGPRVIASRARDLVERHARALEADRIPVPDPSGYRGLGAVDGLLETTRGLTAWIERSL